MHGTHTEQSYMSQMYRLHVQCNLDIVTTCYIPKECDPPPVGKHDDPGPLDWYRSSPGQGTSLIKLPEVCWSGFTNDHGMGVPMEFPMIS